MSTEIRKSLERILECPICQDQMRDATLLKCGHSFCKECLNKMVTSRADAHEATGRARAVMNLPCPCCRKGVRIENRSLGKLKPNLMVNSIVEFLNNADRNDKPGSSKSKPVTSWLSMCEKHPNIEKKFVCERCKVDVCSECLISDHFNHNGDRPMTLKEMKDDLWDVLNESEEWEVRNDSLESQIRYIKEKGTKVLEKLNREVSEEYTRRVGELTDAKERMAMYLEQQEVKFKQEIDTMMHKWKETSSRIRDVRSRMRAGVKRGAPSDIINTYVSCAKRLKKDLSTDVPSREASSKLSDVNSLYFQHGLGSLGRIRHRGGNGESDEEFYYSEVEGLGSDADDDDPVDWSNESVYSGNDHSHDGLSDMDERDSEPSSSSSSSSSNFGRSDTSSIHSQSQRSSSRNSQEFYDT